MTDTADLTAQLDRRRLFRGGVALAGATALAVAAPSVPAEAADGDPVDLGAANQADTTTSVTVTPGSDATLALTNSDGPSLHLEPVSDAWDGVLDVGAIANTTIGPMVGVDLGDGPETVQLATTRDFDGLPTTYALKPIRLVDTRWVGDLLAVVRTSPSAFDSKRRLRADAWIDVAVAPANQGYFYSAAYLNVTATGSTRTGYLTVYPPGDRPRTSTVNFDAERTVANAAFVGVDIVDDFYVVRVHTTAVTDVVIDITGAIVMADTSPAPTERAKSDLRRRRQRQAKMAAQIRHSLAESHER